MVRKSSGHDAQQPYTLVVFYKDRVYNIPVRFIPTTQQYALGREKKGEEVRWQTSPFSHFKPPSKFHGKIERSVFVSRKIHRTVVKLSPP